MNGQNRKRAIALTLGTLAACLLCGAWPRAANAEAGDSAEDALYARTATEVLNRDFAGSRVSYLLLNSRTGSVIAMRWERVDAPVPAGSLVKPFTAVAYVEGHQFRFPEHTCGGATLCWLARGHGRIGVVRAVAVSCNSYFTALARNVNSLAVRDVARRFGLTGPPPDAGAEVLAGAHGAWQESPLAIARAYAELLGRQSQPGVREVVAGMALAAREGTAAGVGRAVPNLTVVAKTGTAPCTHAAHMPGDGFALLAWPADAPRYLLLVREHGHRGAEAAVVAGRMLRALEPPQ